MFSPGAHLKLQTAGAEGPRGPYYWPMARGPVGSYSTSPYRAPQNLSSSLAWSWHEPAGRFKGYSNGAVLIDDAKNLYVGFRSGIRKFSPDGNMIWTHRVNGDYNDVPALMDGALYVTSLQGFVVAVSMESGELLWQSEPVCSWISPTKNKVHEQCDCGTIGGDIGAVAAYRGVVVAKTHQPPGGGACRAAGLNATNGHFLWDYAAEHLIWNFYPIINDDGESFLFQDSAGGAYHVGLDGGEIWKAGIEQEAFHETFTDGGLQVGPNGMVYVVKSFGQGGDPGTVRAFRISDGKYMWESPRMPYASNSWPAVGHMREGDPLTVMAVSGPCGTSSGHNPLFPQVWGLNAETGELLWKWEAPPWHQELFAGEERRILAGIGQCMPNPAGSPSLDAAGNLYLGLLDGQIYRLAPGDSSTSVEALSTFDAQAAFSNGGTALAPGMMAIASCDTFFVFREQ